MSDSLASLLGQKDFRQPPEIIAIKAYVSEHFPGRSVSVKLHDNTLIVVADSAAFVGALKTHVRTMEALVDPPKRIILRIG